jgi:sporulation protein YlmC with PRC-barrel domain
LIKSPFKGGKHILQNHVVAFGEKKMASSSSKSSRLSAFFNGAGRPQASGPPKPIEDQVKDLGKGIEKAPPSANDVRPIRGASTGCMGMVLSASTMPSTSKSGAKMVSKGRITCLIQTDEPLTIPLKVKFKYASPQSEASDEMKKKTEEIKRKYSQAKDVSGDITVKTTLYSGMRLNFTYKSGDDAAGLSFGDQIKIQGLDKSMQYTESKDKLGVLEDKEFCNVNTVKKLGSMSFMQICAVLGKLANEQGIPVVFKRPITDQDLLEQVEKEANHITVVARIGGPKTVLEKDEGYWFVPVGVDSEQLQSAARNDAKAKVPSMKSSFPGYLNVGNEIYGVALSTTWWESTIAAAWDIRSYDLWNKVFRSLVSEAMCVFIIGTFDTKGTSNSLEMCQYPPVPFSSTVTEDEIEEEGTGDRKKVVNYKQLSPSYGLAIDTSVVIPDLLSLVRNGYPILASRLIKSLLPAKQVVPGQVDPPSATQARGFVCANTAPDGVIDSLVKAGWIGIYITTHSPLTNKASQPIPPYQIPADVVFSEYPGEEDDRRSRISKFLAFQKKDTKRNPNPLVVGLEQLSKRSGPPDIKAGEPFIIYLMEPNQYNSAIEKLMKPAEEEDEDELCDTGTLGLLIKQSEQCIETAAKIISNKAKEVATVGQLTLDDLDAEGEEVVLKPKGSAAAATEKPPAEEKKEKKDKKEVKKETKEVKKVAKKVEVEEEQEAEETGENDDTEEVPAHQPEVNDDDFMDDANDKKRDRSAEEEEEEVKAPPPKKPKVSSEETVVKSSLVKKKK